MAYTSRIKSAFSRPLNQVHEDLHLRGFQPPDHNPSPPTQIRRSKHQSIAQDDTRAKPGVTAPPRPILEHSSLEATTHRVSVFGVLMLTPQEHKDVPSASRGRSPFRTPHTRVPKQASSQYPPS
jgi:hypothetical protein